MVDTVMPARRALSTAAASGRPTVVSPSLISTMRAGGTSPSNSVMNVSSESILAKMASPIAVASPRSRPWIADRTAARLVVGGTRTVAMPLKLTSPILISSGTSSRNVVAASLAPSIRLGTTSSACIERLVSIANMMVARSLGTWLTAAGSAYAMIMPANPSSRKNAGI